MSKKTSPNSRQSRISRSRPSSHQAAANAVRPAKTARKTEQKSKQSLPQSMPLTLKAKLRTFVPLSLIPHGIVVILVVIAAFVLLLATSTTMIALPATIATGWLLVHGLPVVGDGLQFSVTPLLVAIIVAYVMGIRVYRAVKDRVTLADLSVIAASVIGIPVILTVIAWAMLLDASVVFPVDPPNIALALMRVVVLYGLAFAFGMGPRLWKVLCRKMRIPRWCVDQALMASRFLAYVLAGSALIVLGSLIFHAADVMASLASYSMLGKLAVVGVSVLYLPNAVIATMAVVFGGEFFIGDAFVSPFSVQLVSMPPLPIFAALPHTSHVAGVAVLAVPVFAAIAALYKRVPRIREVPLFAIFTLIFASALLQATTGALGIYEFVGPSWFTFGAIAGSSFVMAFVIALVVAAVSAMTGRSAAVEVVSVPTLDDATSEDVSDEQETLQEVVDSEDEAPAGEHDTDAEEVSVDEEPVSDDEEDETPIAEDEATQSDEVQEPAVAIEEAETDVDESETVTEESVEKLDASETQVEKDTVYINGIDEAREVLGSAFELDLNDSPIFREIIATRVQKPAPESEDS
ncbi:DUF6350 family protein [Corynebacterium sp. HS2168-gen11]|uniref:cell division protein PerM n=1 Tax=Corynebacterium sp. HS2168-gen11 TaxID=2974027 RepID=UPI00216AE532|nr:DUF6350 family protein [Corynebacterium sp. HS2168-gen11]MCS4536406.1 DUF6350 family protein [Corynebacterium sp. HS2168-gen11]